MAWQAGTRGRYYSSFLAGQATTTIQPLPLLGNLSHSGIWTDFQITGEEDSLRCLRLSDPDGDNQSELWSSAPLELYHHCRYVQPSPRSFRHGSTTPSLTPPRALSSVPRLCCLADMSSPAQDPELVDEYQTLCVLIISTILLVSHINAWRVIVSPATTLR